MKSLFSLSLAEMSKNVAVSTVRMKRIPKITENKNAINLKWIMKEICLFCREGERVRGLEKKGRGGGREAQEGWIQQEGEKTRCRKGGEGGKKREMHLYLVIIL